MTIKAQITEDMKAAMRAHDTARLSALRLLLAAIKQREVDDRVEATDELVGNVIGKLVKQRRDSVTQYTAAGRADLAEKEQFEIDVLSVYLPKQMSDEEIKAVVDAAIAETGAAGMAAMGKVMGIVKGKCAGKADMGKVSALVKAALSA
ncbi:MAG: GatB/YqeY domain-containing protein [Sutterellaceae bacterium]|nr:GatB/YqeY domain-containing protein [Sutterellaceae bacterium]